MHLLKRPSTLRGVICFAGLVMGLGLWSDRGLADSAAPAEKQDDMDDQSIVSVAVVRMPETSVPASGSVMQ